jgi:hypothetical protein
MGHRGTGPKPAGTGTQKAGAGLRDKEIVRNWGVSTRASSASHSGTVTHTIVARRMPHVARTWRGGRGPPTVMDCYQQPMEELEHHD